tara:strand:- start:307 stop:1242 length:936 start_codon:yes stop_codon:yes gene_type:complete
MSLFKQAKRSDRKLRMAIAGVSGSGKTFTSLGLASLLGDSTAVIDTERSSSEIYSTKWPFLVCNLDSYHPQKYIDALNEAAKAGVETVVIDSLSHAWSGKDGALDQVSKAGKSFNAWSKVTPLQDKLMDTILKYPGHVICTMRRKTSYEQSRDDNGKLSITKTGMASIQREGVDYEFDIFATMDGQNNMTIEKSRCPELSGEIFAHPGEEVSNIIKKWLEGESQSSPKLKKPKEKDVPMPTLPPKSSLPEKAVNDLSKLFAGKEDMVIKFLKIKGQIKEGETWQQMTSEYASKVLQSPSVFLASVVAQCDS